MADIVKPNIGVSFDCQRLYLTHYIYTLLDLWDVVICISFFAVGIASDLQDALESKLDAIERELKLLPDLRNVDEDDIEDIVELLATLLIETTIFSIFPEIVGTI